MVQLKDINKIENGAHFHSVDLHIHSYGASHDVSDSKMTTDNIVDSAIQQGLSVIAITDHNSNLNVQKAVDYAKSNYQGKILVLPGVEVTTAHGHLLVYFDPDQTANLSKFISRIDLIGEMGADNTRTSMSMSNTIKEAYELGGICIAAHIDRSKTGFEMFASGFQNWKKDIIISPGLYGLECDSKEALLWYSEFDEDGQAGVERRKLFIARQSVPELAARSQLAHIQGSDSHSMGQFEYQSTNKTWTRIKLAELSFNSLRVALVDPTARVRNYTSMPRSTPRIRGVSFTGGFLHGEMVNFSSNLNCLIGGRGTGKSTAIRALAYAFGINNDFSNYDNCPDSIIVWCEDQNGVLYRYSRTRGGDIEVKAKEDASIIDVPSDAFHIEYFGQGELAKVAEDPLKNPELFQEFLDRHIDLRDFLQTEELLVNKLKENASRLLPLESAFLQLKEKKKTLQEVEKKLEVAEEGNLRGVIGTQSKLASEKIVRESIDAIATEYTNGYKFTNIQRNFDQILETAGTCTEDENSIKILASIKSILTSNNNAIKKKEAEVNELLAACAERLTQLIQELKTNHQKMSQDVATKLADLKDRGLITSIPGLDQLLNQKTSVAKDVTRVEQRKDELIQCRKERTQLLLQLKDIRDKMTKRRKEQLRGINTNLRRTIQDYIIFVRYDNAGITRDFESFLQEKMHGTYFQDNLIEQVCNNITPSELADMVLSRNTIEIATSAHISQDWADKIIDKLCYWDILFDLQILAKQPKPIITVQTKSSPQRYIPVLQLSDGQRHTILLSIAMLAESNIPLVIDQPEDDLDNAFIFSSIVTTLRAIKEKRQVVLVTHNANIAVLGDSELILPMFRENDYGNIKDRGSIDAHKTKQCVMDILEGGSEAFLKRKEMYNH